MKNSIWMVSVDKKLFEPCYEITTDLKAFYKKDKAVDCFQKQILEAKENKLFLECEVDFETDDYFEITDENNIITVSLFELDIE